MEPSRHSWAELSKFTRPGIQKVIVSSAKVPSQLGRLSKLTGLNLNDNQLTKVPSQLGELSELIYLDFGNNQLTKVPSQLGKLSQLITLNLQSNPALSMISLPDEVKALQQNGTKIII